MAQANIGSRRACEELIERGRVKVNGETITLGDKADSATDIIEVDGEKLNFASLPKIYVALNKPINVLSTNIARKGEDRRTVREMIPIEGHLFTIGRLDAESEGLIVLTNDGDLANRLTHPRYRHTKTYKVTVYGLPPADIIRQWEMGIDLGEDGMTAPCSVSIIKGDKNLTSLKIIMTEGKKRQIRRVATKLGYPVRHLVRTHIGKLELGELRLGEWRELNADDLKALQTPEVQFRAAAPQRRRNYRPKRTGPSTPKTRGKSKRSTGRKPDNSRRTQRSIKRTK